MICYLTSLPQDSNAQKSLRTIALVHWASLLGLLCGQAALVESFRHGTWKPAGARGVEMEGIAVCYARFSQGV